MKAKFLIIFLNFLNSLLSFANAQALDEKNWDELGERKEFPLGHFFGLDQGSLHEALLPEKTEYVPPKDLNKSEGFVQYTPTQFIPEMREFFLPGRFSKNEKVASCVFVGGAKGESIYFMREGAVCRVKDRWLNMNIVYTVLRKSKTISLSKRHLYYYIATVRLQSFVGSKGSHATVKILNSKTEIEEGDIMVPYESFKSRVNVVDKKPGVAFQPTKIVSFSREVLDVSGSEDFVFIPRGSESGFVKGRIYALHRTNNWEKKFTSPSSYVVDDLMLVGKVLIVDVNEVGSVGYVLDARGELYKEDIVGDKWDKGFHQ